MNMCSMMENSSLYEVVQAIVSGSSNSSLRNHTFQIHVLPKVTQNQLTSLIKSNEKVNDKKMTIFGTACKNNVSKVVEYLAENCLADINLGTPTPLWQASNEGHYDVVKVLAKYPNKIDFTTPAPDGTTPIMIAIAKDYIKLLPLFEEFYGKDSRQITKDCTKFGKTGMLLDIKGGKTFSTEELRELMNDAIISDCIKTFTIIRTLFEEGEFPIQKAKHLAEQRFSLEIRKNIKGSTLLQRSPLVDMSKRFPVFNDSIEESWTTGWMPSHDADSNLYYIDLSKYENAQKYCCLPKNLEDQTLSEMELPIKCFHRDVEKSEECRVIRDMLLTCQRLERKLNEECEEMCFLNPQFTLIGSVAEGTRMGKANEADLTVRFAGLEKCPFKVGKNATELIFDDKEGGPELNNFKLKFCKTGTLVFDYPKFLYFFLQTLESCLRKMDLSDTGLTVEIWNRDFQCCSVCEQTSEAASKSIYRPVKHCANCLPAVTHTKSGPCIILKYCKTKDKADLFPVTIDLIPVYPIICDDLLELFTLAVKTLVEETPPFWLDYFNSLIKRDIILPEAFSENQNEDENSPIKESAKKKTQDVSLKLLHYGPDPNYLIRPGQKMRITAFHSNYTLLRIYIHMKALKDLLGVDIKSYHMKKVVLLPEFRAKVHPTGTLTKEELDAGLQPDEDLFIKALLEVFSHPEIRKAFESKVDYARWKMNLNIPLIMENNENLLQDNS